MNILLGMPADEIRDSFVDTAAFERLNKLGNLIINQNAEPYTREGLSKALKNTDIIMTGWGYCQTLLDKSMLDGSPLKLIAHTGGSVGQILDMNVYDTDVNVISGNYYYAESVAEGVLAYMLFMLRKMDFYSGNLKSGVWLEGPDSRTEGILDQTVGIVSVSTISKILMQMAKPFRMKFKVFSTRPDERLAKELGFSYAGLDEIFETCKIVSVHTALNEHTRHMIGKDLFAKLQDDSVFINTSRGAILDETALIEALKKNRFRALLDVYEVEPLPKDSPLLKLDNLTAFPHQAGPTTDRRPRITHAIIDDIEKFIDGKKMENIITKEVAQKMTK